uniref:Uncharacterized protein LOC102806697 n=1 Tax=Saccoglossus kowalevskii TaxID=10224 RepID=A0ABM0M1D2_SACKO|nr:PREDICTED: uncharacterized protein LOC102806697 [Saccoglossus kowalevskii]
MEPLGSGKKWQPLLTLDGFPKPEEFYTKYVQPSIPVIFKDAARDYPAFKQWNDQFLMSLPETSKERVFIERAKKEIRSKSGFESTFEQFLKTYNNTDIYMVATVPKYLRKYIPLPDPLRCNTLIDELVDTVMWFSSGGTKSVLHNDDVDNINCLYRGRKELLFIDFLKYRKTQMLHNAHEVENKALESFPLFHQVNSFDANLAVNVWFNHRPKLDVSADKCGDPQPNSIANVFFETDASDIVGPDPIKTFLSYVKTGSISFDEFQKKMKTDSTLLPVLEQWTEECDELSGELFQLIDFDKDALLSKEDVINLYEMENKETPETEEIADIMEAFNEIMIEQQAILAENAYKRLKAEGNSAKKEEL